MSEKSSPQPKPAKFVLVPEDPTPKMIAAGYRKLYGDMAAPSDAECCWAAMLAAAPAIPAPEGAPLPPLPVATVRPSTLVPGRGGPLGALYTADQMRAYARDALAAPAPQAAELTKAQVDAIWESPTPQGTGKSRYDLARELIAAARALRPAPAEAHGIEVSVGRMTESNGRVTWMVMLHRQGTQTLLNGHQVYSSHIEGRAQYEAASLRHFLGQGPEPDILDYDTDGAAQSDVQPKGLTVEADPDAPAIIAGLERLFTKGTPDHVPAGPEIEAAVDAKLGIVTLPPVRVDAETFAAIERLSKANGLIVQATVRDMIYGACRATGETPAAPSPAPAPDDKALTQALEERDAASDYIDALLDEVLGKDRNEWTSNYGHADAMDEVRERMAALQSSLDFHKRRCDALQACQSTMRDPERTMVCDILANGSLLINGNGKLAAERYAVPCAAVGADDFAKQLADLCQQHEKKLLAHMAREVALKNYETAMRTPLFQQARAVMGTENEWQDNALRAAILHYMTAPSHPPVQGSGS